MEKTRNLGIDILCALAGMLLLGACLFEQIGLEQITITDISGALPVAARWFCMSGTLLLAACAGFVLSTRKYAASHFKTIGRLLYIYLLGSVCAIAARRFLIGEEMTATQILQEFLHFSTSSTGHVIGMYFLLMFAAPFLNTAFQGLRSKNARMTFVVIPAAFGTLQPILQFGEFSLIPQWCTVLAPIAAYLGGAFIRKYNKRRDIAILTIFALLAFAAQVAAALLTSLRAGFIDCPWLDHVAALPSLLTALALVGLFHSRREGSGTAHRFFGGAAGGTLLGIMVAEPLLRCVLLNMIDSFPIMSTRLVAGIAVVPLVYIMCTALGLMLQFPIIMRRQVKYNAELERAEREKRKKRRKQKPSPKPVEAPAVETEYDEEPEVSEELEISDDVQTEEEPEFFEDAQETDRSDDEPDEEYEPDAQPETEDSEEFVLEDEIADMPEEPDEPEESDEPEELDEPDEEPEDEEYEEEPPVNPTVSISLPHRVSHPLPQASENSSRHTITVPVTQPETEIRLTQPPVEPPIGARVASRPMPAEERPAYTRPAALQPTYTQPTYTSPVQQPAEEPDGFQTKSFTLDEILTEQGIPVKHMPETVDDLIKELTK